MLWSVGLINIPCTVRITRASSSCRRSIYQLQGVQTEQADDFTLNCIFCFYPKHYNTPNIYRCLQSQTQCNTVVRAASGTPLWLPLLSLTKLCYSLTLLKLYRAVLYRMRPFHVPYRLQYAPELLWTWQKENADLSVTLVGFADLRDHNFHLKSQFL